MKRIVIVLSIFFIIGIVSLTTLYLLLSKTIIYDATSIKICCLGNQEKKNISVTGTTPFNRNLQFPYNYSLDCWYSYPCFYKSLQISVPNSLAPKISFINVYTGDLYYKISGHDFFKMCRPVLVSKSDKIYLFPEFIKRKDKVIAKILSIFRWGDFHYLLNGLLLILIFLFIIFIIRNYNRVLSFSRILNFRLKRKNNQTFRKVTTIIFQTIIFIITVSIAGYIYQSGPNNISFIYSILFLFNSLIALFFFFSHIIKLINLSKTLALNIRILIISLFIFFFIIEIILRLVGVHRTPYEKLRGSYKSHYIIKGSPWYCIYPRNYHCFFKYPEFIQERTSNNEGLADKYYPQEKNTGEYRIISIGDSFTEGFGTSADSSWPKVLEKNLRNRCNNQLITVINAGHSGSDPFFEYVLLRDKLMKYNPDLVLMAVNQTDIYDALIRGGMERFKADSTLNELMPKWERLYALSYITRLIIHNVLKYDDYLFKKTDYDKNMGKGIEMIYTAVKLTNALVTGNHSDFIVIFHPSKDEIKSQNFILKKLIHQLEAETHIKFIDLFEYYSTTEKMSKHNLIEYYWPLDSHHNANGYAVFARGVEWKLKQMGIIDSLKQGK